MFDFTNRVKKVINEYAPKEAKRLRHEYLGPEHILLGLLKAQDSVAIKILQNLNVSLTDLKKEIEKRCDQDSITLLVDPVSSDKVQRVLEYSREEARKLRHSYIGSEHILLAILRDTSSIAAASLSPFNVTYQVIRNELNQTLGLPQESQVNFRFGQQVKKEQFKTSVLDEYSRNFTKMASENAIDPVIGREKETERVVQILARKTKNNPILIGEAGVGKTAIIEGLAQKVLNKEIPEALFDSSVYSLDVAALIAGTKYRGEFEDRLKKIMNEVRKNKNVILFIDEIHIIIGAGAAEGAVDAANILKPALARGEIQCIGATTIKEYKKYIEKDSALERRFQMIMVDEPSLEDTIRILSGLRKSYEKYHGVIYTKDSIQAAVRLSNRFITDRYLPDKAIDILDEAGARARLKNSVIPKTLKSFENLMINMAKDKDKMVYLQKYEKAAQLRDEIVSLEKKYNEKLSNWRKKQKEKRIRILEEDVVRVMSEWTSIPLQQLKASESKKLVSMEEKIGEYVVGQKNAIHQIAKAVRRSRSGFKAVNRPIGSFIFLGPTGVGKTELAKMLAKFMFGSKDSLMRFDMSEYMEMHSIAKFIGSPPGYVGYEEGGQLTEAVKRKPYSILLFDEIEKAHSDVHNILLQILDEGELTDTMGHKVNFKETIIIMTSNIGARYLLKGGKMGFGDIQEKKKAKEDQILEETKKYFSPEFLNRVDDVIVFDSLDEKSVLNIVNILIYEMNQNTIHKDIYISVSENAKQYLAKQGYDEKYGARPLKRFIEKEIEDELSLKFLEGKLKPPVKAQVDFQNNKLTFRFLKISAAMIKKLKDKYLPDEQVIDVIWDEFKQEDGKESSKGPNEASPSSYSDSKIELAST